MAVGRRRTRKEKERAALRLATDQGVFHFSPKENVRDEGLGAEKTPWVQERTWGEILDTGVVKKDLLRTVIVIVLALALEMGVYWIVRMGKLPIG
jgi:hypothetical protein